VSNVTEILGKLEKTHKQKLTLDGDDPPRLGTGIFAFDLATGGGIPMGRVTVLYGSEGSMKSSLALKLIAQAQREYPHLKCVYVDVEGHYSRPWAAQMGVDAEKLIVLAPQSAEQVIDMVESLLYADDIAVVVVDSLAAMVTERELGSDAEKAQVGSTGLMINKFYRKSGIALGKAKMEGKFPTLVCINQIRFKVGVMFGNPETTPGGPSFNFASSMTIRLYGKDIKDPEISKSLPAFRKVTGSVKKKKVEIVAQNFEFQLALIQNPKFNLEVGQLYDHASIITYLKAYDLIKKTDDGWLIEMDAESGLENRVYPKQDDFKQDFKEDTVFADALRKMIIRTVLTKGNKVEAEVEVKGGDDE